MAQNIKLKRSSVAGKVPTTSQLEAGEIAINTADGKLYFERDDSTIQTIVTTNAVVTGSLNINGSVTATNFTGSLLGNASTATLATSATSASHAATASYVNTLRQDVIITGSLTVGATAVGGNENTLILGPPPGGGSGEGGQLLLQAAGGTYTSASMLDNWQDYTRLLRGTNAGSDAVVAQWNMHSKQMILPQYNSTSAFPGTVVGVLGFDSSGNILTATGSGASLSGGSGSYVARWASTNSLTTGSIYDNGTNVAVGGTSPSYKLDVTGDIRATGAIYANANGAMYFQGGDDVALYDINVANTLGVYGQQDSTIGSVKLGSGGGTVSGKSGNIGINTTSPTSASLTVNGNVWATSFTGSLLGNASTATSASYAVSASYATTASYAKNLVISGSISTVDYIDFNTTATVTQPVAGRVSWNSGDGTLDLGLDGGATTIQLGQSQAAKAYNAEATSLTKGEVVYISGSQGQRIAIKRAVATAELGSANTIGIVAETITAGAEGYVLTEGQLKGLNTSAYTAGALLYLSTTSGQFTETSPAAPNHRVTIGFVERVHASAGSIYVKIDNGYEIDELHNVLINGVSAGDLLVRSGSVWHNSKTLSGSYVLTGSLTATGQFIGSLNGNAATATSASQATEADLLDGQHGSYYLNASNINAGTIADAYLPGTISSDITGNAATATSASFATTASYVLNAVSASFAATASSAVAATRASTVSISGISTDASYTFPLIVTGSSGPSIGLSIDTVTGIIYNPSTNLFRVTNLSATGSIFGTASYASDADLLDGQHGSYYLDASNINAGTIGDAYLPATISSDITGNAATATTASFALTASAVSQLNQNVTIVGNLTVFGTSSFTYTTSSQLAVDAAFISVNVFEPVERFGGLKVYDSGSSNATASLAWDSLHNHWVYQNVDGSTYTGGMLLSGPRNTGSLGDEPSLTKWFVPRSDGGDHLDNSQIYSSGSVTKITGSLTTSGKVNIETVDNYGSDPDKFLAIVSNEVVYRTGAQLLSDIGGQTAGTFVQNAGAGGVARYIMRYADSNSATTSSIYESTAGNIGINTTNPSAPLDVDGNAVVSGSLTVLGGTTTTGVAYFNSIDLGSLTTGAAALLGASGSVIANGASNAGVISIALANYEAMFVDYVLYDFAKANKRAGTVRLNWNASQVVLDETSTGDIGNTSGFTFTASNDGTTVKLLASNSVGQTMYLAYEYKLLYIV